MADIRVEPRRRSPGGLILIVLLVAVVAALALWYLTRDDAGHPATDVETEVSDETPRDPLGQAGDAVRDAAEATGDAVQGAADAVGDAVDRATDGEATDGE